MIKQAIHDTWRTLASLTFFFWLSAILVAAMVVGTLAPQWNLYRQMWFMALLGVLGVSVVACVAYRWKAIRWPSLISHIGILAILGGAVVSLVGGQHGTLALMEGEPGDCCVKGEGDKMAAHLPFTVGLKKFSIEYYGKSRHVIHVTHVTKGLTRQLEVEPGREYDLKEMATKVTVKKFVPDFMIDLASKKIVTRSEQPRNPALLVSVESSPAKEMWVFAKFPGMHQEDAPVQVAYEYQMPQVKQFKSRLEVKSREGQALHGEEIWVNKPMKYQGYTFYQSGYDPENPGVSILQVAKDPGVPYVYGGFGILLAGLTLNVLRKRP